jgi:hypothetical protein
MTISAHFSDSCWTDASDGAKVFLLDVLVNQKFPEFFITYCHKQSPFGKQKSPTKRQSFWKSN